MFHARFVSENKVHKTLKNIGELIIDLIPTAFLGPRNADRF